MNEEEGVDLTMNEIEDIYSYPIIGELNDQDLRLIRTYLRVNAYENGTAILQQHQISADLHIIIEGILDVYVEQGSRVHVAKLEAGHFFGEMSCLTGSAVSATVQANGMVRTVSLPREGMLQLMDTSSFFLKHMIEAMTEGIVNSDDRVLEEYVRSSAVSRQLQKEQQSKYGQLVGNSEFMQQLRIKITKQSREKNDCVSLVKKGLGNLILPGTSTNNQNSLIGRLS